MMETGGSEANAIRMLEMASEPPFLEMKMRISRRSQLSGKIHTMDLPVTEDQLNEYYYGDGRRLIQDIFPNLDAGQREFLMTGITPAEWDFLFPPEEEHEYLGNEPAF